MNPLPDEKSLLQSDNGALVLTSHRVRYGMKTTGFSKFTSIMLEELSVCEVTTTSKPWLLVIALIIFLAGFFLSTDRDLSPAIMGTVIALCLVIGYFATRATVISLRSAGGAINAPVQGMTADAARGFIDAVEATKNERYFAARKAAAASA